MATYRVILEQNPSSILISDAIGPEKWVVENFDFISPGLLVIKMTIYISLICGAMKLNIEKCFILADGFG